MPWHHPVFWCVYVIGAGILYHLSLFTIDKVTGYLFAGNPPDAPQPTNLSWKQSDWL